LSSRNEAADILCHINRPNPVTGRAKQGERKAKPDLIPESSNFYRLLPYLIPLIVLAFTSKSSRAPKAEGIPYDIGSR